VYGSRPRDATGAGRIGIAIRRLLPSRAVSTDAPPSAPPSPPPTTSRRLLSFVPGLALCVALAAGAIWLAEVPWVKDTLHWSALLLVILLGMAWKTLAPVPGAALPGVRMAQRAVLRWAVAGLGFRLSVEQLGKIGGPALVVVVVSTACALVFGWWIARRLRVGQGLGLLLGVGGAICGASAIVAADSVVQGERRDSAVALGVVTLLGTIGILVYPPLGHALGLPEFVYGVWDGASLHEMAQVVAAGLGFSARAGEVATVVKLARIALLAPTVLWLAWSMRRHHLRAGTPHVAALPWFLVLFVAFAAVRSTGWLPADAIRGIERVDLWLLCVGMAGVGLQTGLADLKDAGARPILAATLQWVVLSGLSLGLALWICR
jgi:uncharacterized integral membrane protein (TIGR00698 family)